MFTRHIHIEEDLKECYSQQAPHFHQTRKKNRPEVDYMLTLLQERNGSSVVRYLDLGCGSGRLSSLLLARLGQERKLIYEGVDFSQGMIDLASLEYPEHTFYCADMLEHVSLLPQESRDVCILLASMQHMQTLQDRRLLLSHIYRILTRGGSCFLINWSISYRFLKKYRQQVAKSLILAGFFQREWNDVRIPRKDPNHKKNSRIYKRYYHMFTLGELALLSQEAGFVIEQGGYIGKDGSFTHHPQGWKHARTTFFYLRKAL